MGFELKRLLVVDDEASMRHMLRLVLEREGYRIEEAVSGGEALERLRNESFDALLCDIRMPGIDGLGLLQRLEGLEGRPTVIMMSAYGSIDTAIECMKKGAFDYISKPFKPDEVLLTLKKAEERLRLQRENRRLREELSRSAPRRELVYSSPAMERVMELVRRVAEVDSPVLITGETGTGKELVARALHDQGGRRDAPFVAVNCSAIAAGLLESELFGHARGAFTGADREREGLFAAAEGGTLFLDEIGELPLELQPKLLRVLQEGEVRRVGESRPRKVDVRVLAATGRDLKQEASKGSFREDLYYRLNVIDIALPPLRERSEDIPALVRHFVTRIARRERRPAPELSAEALAALQGYDWPGNVRELENFMEKTMIFCRGERITLADLPWDVRRSRREKNDQYSLKRSVTRMEEEYIRKALDATGGNRTQAAKLLEISLRSLIYKIKDYGIR